MTVSIAIVRNPDYYQDDLEDSLDYYIAADAEVHAKSDAPRWVGGMAEALGINGKLMTPEDSLYLLNGFDPRSRIPVGMSAEEALATGQLKPLRKSADAESLGMSLLSRKMRLLQKAKDTRALTAHESRTLVEGTADLKLWNGRLKETREVTAEHDLLMAAKRSGVVWDGETGNFQVYSRKHEARREQLGKKLAEMPGGQRQAVDFTYSLCKEMSIPYARATDEEKALMREAFQKETATLVARRLNAHAETRDYAGVRKGENPTVVRAAGMASVIVHDTTRAVKDPANGNVNEQAPETEASDNIAKGDQVLKGIAPGLHAHAIFINLTLDEKGKYRSLSTETLEDMRKEMDAELHARMVEVFNGLKNSKGEHFCAFDAGEPHAKSVVGISAPGITRDDVESVSGRSLAIKALRESAQVEGKKIDYSFGKLETREAKLQGGDIAATYKAWGEHLDDRGITRASLGMGKEGNGVRQKVEEARALRRQALNREPDIHDYLILEKLCAQKANFTPSELRQALWVDAVGHGDFNIDARMERILNNPVLAIEADQAKVAAAVDGQKMKASKERVYVLSQGLREERAFDALARAMAIDNGIGIGTEAQASAIIASTQKHRQEANPNFQWRADQAAIIEAILTTGSKAVVVKAPPGSGKTTALSAVVAFAKDQGIDHVILAPSHKAKSGAMRDAEMLEGHAIQGFVKNKKELDKIKKGTLIFVDESSMVDLPDMLKLFQEVNKRGGRIGMFGDTQQLAAVGRGDPMARFQEVAPGAVLELTAITRQKAEAERNKEFVMAQYEGRHEAFVAMMEEQGAIAVLDTLEAKQTAFVDFYFSRDCKMEEKVMLAGTNADCATLNAMIREQLIAQGKLGSEGVSLMCEGAGGTRSQREFRTGDRILFTKGIAEEAPKGLLSLLGFGKKEPAALADTSDTGTVLSARVAKDGKSVDFQVAIDGKGIVNFNSKNEAHLDHAYVLTTHRSQGMTVDLCGYFFNAMSGSESLLVGMSRHRYATKIFCLPKEREALEEAASRKTEKVRGADLAEASRNLLGANDALAKLAREFNTAKFFGEAALLKFYARSEAAEMKTEIFAEQALSFYAEHKLGEIKVVAPVESEEQVAIKKLVAVAQAGIENFKTIEVPFDQKAKAKAAGAVWMPERGGWVAPTEHEGALLAMFEERKVHAGTRANPASVAGLASIDGTIEGLSPTGKNLLVWDADGVCRSVPMSSPVLRATAQGQTWSHTESFGERLAALQGANITIDLDQAQAKQVSIHAKGESVDFAINANGRLDGKVRGARIALAASGLAESVGIDKRQIQARHDAVNRARPVLNVKFGERDEAQASGAEWDGAKQSWVAPRGLEIELTARWGLKDRAQQLPDEQSAAIMTSGTTPERAWIEPAKIINNKKENNDELPNLTENTRRAMLAVEVFQSELENPGRESAPDQLASLRHLSSVPLVQHERRSEMLLSSDALDRLGRQGGAGSELRRPGVGDSQDAGARSGREEGAGLEEPTRAPTIASIAGLPGAVLPDTASAAAHAGAKPQSALGAVILPSKDLAEHRFKKAASAALGAVAKAAKAIGKSVGIESKADLAAKAQALATAKAEAKAAAQAARVVELARARCEKIHLAIQHAFDTRESNPELSRAVWKTALEQVAKGGFDPMAESAGSSLVHGLARVAPSMGGVLKDDGRFMDGHDALKIAVKLAGGEATMALKDIKGETPEQALAKAKLVEDARKALVAKALANVPEGQSPSKPIASSKLAHGKILDGTIVEIERGSLIFKANDDGESVFYRLPRADIFGHKGQAGLELDATENTTLKIKVENGVATCAFISNPAAETDPLAPKELAVERTAKGAFQIEAIKAPVERIMVQSMSAAAPTPKYAAQRGFSF